MGFKVDASQLIKGLESFNNKGQTAIRMYAETVAKDLESYAKIHRPWTDRTGRARQGLSGYVEPTATGYRIYLAHTVDYGIWLEMAHEKRFAILEPTVRLKGSSAVKGMARLLERLR